MKKNILCLGLAVLACAPFTVHAAQSKDQKDLVILRVTYQLKQPVLVPGTSTTYFMVKESPVSLPGEDCRVWATVSTSAESDVVNVTPTSITCPQQDGRSLTATTNGYLSGANGKHGIVGVRDNEKATLRVPEGDVVMALTTLGKFQ